MILSFHEWLIDQQYREDLIGDLARVPSLQEIVREGARRKVDEHKNWAEIIIRIAEPGYITVFNEAWQEFLLEKEVVADSLD